MHCAHCMCLGCMVVFVCGGVDVSCMCWGDWVQAHIMYIVCAWGVWLYLCVVWGVQVCIMCIVYAWVWLCLCVGGCVSWGGGGVQACIV